MAIHAQQGRRTKQGSVITLMFKWKVGDELPVIDQTVEYPQYAVLTGEMEAGWPATNAVNQLWLGEISTVDIERREVTIITPYPVFEKALAQAAITAENIGKFVFQGQKVLLYVPESHDASDVQGLVVTAAAEADAPVWILRK